MKVSLRSVTVGFLTLFFLLIPGGAYTQDSFLAPNRPDVDVPQPSRSSQIDQEVFKQQYIYGRGGYYRRGPYGDPYYVPDRRVVVPAPAYRGPYYGDYYY